MKKLLLLAALIVAAAASLKADWPFRAHRYDSFRATPVNEKSIVFFGNSITNMNEWREVFGDHPDIVNRGNSGGYSYELLDNVETVIMGHPAKLFIGIGTNDLGTEGQDSPELVCSRIRAIVERVHDESPRTEVYVQSILPSEVGLRDHSKTIPTNALLKEMCGETGATFVDLWEPLAGITSDRSVSFEGLHLTAKGYTIWGREIAKYVGAECSMPDPATAEYNSCNLNGSYGMRFTSFSAYTVKPTDILIIGDEMVHGGEWHELLNNPDVKNRGTVWGYGGHNITDWIRCMDAIFDANPSRKAAPAKVFLYVGQVPLYGNTEMSVIINNYTALINRIRRSAPSTEINIMSLVPRSNANDNSNLTLPFNDRLKALANSFDNVNYVDIYTPLSINGGADADPACITGNYVYGKGYNRIAQVLAPLTGGTAMTDAQFDAHYALLMARTELGALMQKAAGSSPELTAAVADARKLLRGNPSLDELEAAVSRLSDAMMPAGGKDVFYTISDQRLGRFCAEQNSLVTSVTLADSGNAAAQWNLVPRSDGSFDIVNHQTGNFVTPDASYNTQLTTSASAPATGWLLKPSETIGAFIIVNGSAQFNTTQGGLGYKVYNWGGGTNTSDTGCQYYFAEVEGAEPVEPVKPGEDASNPVLTLTDIDLSAGPYRLSDADAAAILDNEGAQTVAIDFTKNAADNNRHILVSACGDQPGGCHFSIFADNRGYGAIYTGLSNNTEGWYTRGSALAGRHTMVFTIDTSAYGYYADGASAGKITSGFGDYGCSSFGRAPEATAIYIGGTKHSADNGKVNFGGEIHSVRFYDRALTDAEVASLVWDGLTPTGIEDVAPDAPASAKGIFDLQGRPLREAAAPGLYIIDGRKVLVR